MKMKYALVDGERQEAKEGLSGRCQCCDTPVIPKCGDIRMHHWAHIKEQKCDPWKEGETEWHRAWKNQFPKEWQEIVYPVGNGQNHRADVKTGQGHVLEFQYSPIASEECQARENFYGKMIWIVNGTRRLKDKDKFIGAKYSEPEGSKIGVERVRNHFCESALLRDWSDSRVPVFFDFEEDMLWCIWPKNYVKDNSIRIAQLLEQEGIHLGKKLDISKFLRSKSTEGGYVFRVERKVLVAMLQADHFETVCQGWGKTIADYDHHLNMQSVLKEVQSQTVNYAHYRSPRSRSIRL